MTRILLLSLLAGTIFISSCGDRDAVNVIPPDVNFGLTFKALYDGQPLEKYKDYAYDNYTVSFSRFNTYVSNVTLLKGTEEVLLADVEWVDFTPDLAPDNNAVPVTKWYRVPEGAYTGVKIGFGVRPDLNAKQPRDFPADHPLAREIEYWLGWKSYIFTKIEGQGTSPASASPDIFMLFHCGSDAVYREYTFNHDIQVKEGVEQEIMLDLKKLFTINGDWFDLTVPTNQYTSNNPADVTVATILMDNFANAVDMP